MSERIPHTNAWLREWFQQPERQDPAPANPTISTPAVGRRESKKRKKLGNTMPGSYPVYGSDEQYALSSSVQVVDWPTGENDKNGPSSIDAVKLVVPMPTTLPTAGGAGLHAVEPSASTMEPGAPLFGSDHYQSNHIETMVTRVEKPTAALKELSSLSSQIIEYRQHCVAQATEFTSQVEQWKSSDAAKELTIVRELEQLRRDLATSSSQIIELQKRCEAQSTELTSHREQLESLHGRPGHTVAMLNDQIEQWKCENATKAEELARARKDLEELQSRLSNGNSTLVSVEARKLYERISTNDYAAVIELTAKVDQWLCADTKRAKGFAFEPEKRDKENEELRQNLVTLRDIYIRAPELKLIFQSETIENYEEQLKKLQSALTERQSQLDGVQRFVTTADTYADSIIIQILQKLNAEVQQNTTFMAECILEDWTTQPTKEQPSAAQRASESIGHTLVGCLLRKELDDVALYLPIAFQAYITYYLRLLISSWTTERGYNDLINKIYEQMQQSEAQATSGRWRSLTRTYISPGSMSAPSSLVSYIVSGLSDIVVAAGCAPSLSAAQSKVSIKFGDKLSSIITIAGQFSKMIGEVVSGDFEVLAFSPTEAFDEVTMEVDVDDVDEVEDGTSQKVLCSTQLGMTKRMQLESGKKHVLTVIKTKVILESFLDG